LYLDWKSKARYANLIADPTDHGYAISNFNDDYPNGLPIPHKLDLKELMRNNEKDDNFY